MFRSLCGMCLFIPTYTSTVHLRCPRTFWLFLPRRPSCQPHPPGCVGTWLPFSSQSLCYFFSKHSCCWKLPLWWARRTQMVYHFVSPHCVSFLLQLFCSFAFYSRGTEHFPGRQKNKNTSMTLSHVQCIMYRFIYWKCSYDKWSCLSLFNLINHEINKVSWDTIYRIYTWFDLDRFKNCHPLHLIWIRKYCDPVIMQS